jgi:hypothetical protein
MPNDPYRGRTAPLTSKRCILYIYSTNIDSEYFKHAIYSTFFSLKKCSLFHNSNIFGSCIIHRIYTGCAKIKKNNSGVKRLIILCTYRFFVYELTLTKTFSSTSAPTVFFVTCVADLVENKLFLTCNGKE